MVIIMLIVNLLQLKSFRCFHFISVVTWSLGQVLCRFYCILCQPLRNISVLGENSFIEANSDVLIADCRLGLLGVLLYAGVPW